VWLPGHDDAYALPKVALLQVASLAGAAMFLGYVVAGGSVSRSVSPIIDVPLLTFTALTVVSAILSVDQRQSVLGEPYQYQGLVTTLAYVGSFYAARLALGTRPRFLALLYAVVAGGIVSVAYGLAQWLGADPLRSGSLPQGRVIAGVGQPNDLAAFLLIVLCAGYGIWRLGRQVPWGGRVRPRRIVLAALAGLAMAVLTMTFSRAGYLVLGGLILLVAALHVRRERWHAGAAVAVLSLAVASLLVVATLAPVRDIADRAVARALSAFDTPDGSIRSHLDLWAVGLAMTVEHPIVGTGPETYPIVFPDYRDRVLSPERARVLSRFRPESPHNAFLGFAASSGVPALVAYLAFLTGLSVTFVRSVRDQREPAVQATAVVCGLVLFCHVATDLFKTPDVTTSWLSFVVIGAGLGAIAIPPGLGEARDGDKDRQGEDDHVPSHR
jgi:O-antigen ligase